MNDPHDYASLLIHLRYIKDGIDALNVKVDRQNGRIGVTEQDIAVLKDRSTEARTTGAVWGGGIGAGAGAAVAALWHLFGGGK
jgi:hypothetical protein